MKITINIQDAISEVSEEVDIEITPQGISIHPKGTSTCIAANSAPIFIEKFDGKWNFYIWDDVNQEDYTQRLSVSLDNAKEELYKRKFGEER